MKEAALRGRLFSFGPEIEDYRHTGSPGPRLKLGARDSEVVRIPQTCAQGRDLKDMDRRLAEVAA
jgi:hypothetical protein